jgi:hypothetical protein
MDSSRANDTAKARILRSNVALGAGRGAFLGFLVVNAYGVGLPRNLDAVWAWVVFLPAILYVASELGPRRLGSWLGVRSTAWADRLDAKLEKVYWGWLSGRAAGTLIVVGCLLVFPLVLISPFHLWGGIYVRYAEYLIYPGVITWFWAAGAQRRPLQVMRFGILAGAVAGVAWEASDSLILLMLPPVPESLGFFAKFRLYLMSAIRWALYGFAGAITIEHAGRLPLGLRVGAGVMAGALVFDLLTWLFGGTQTGWQPLLGQLLLAAGWGFGLARYQLSETILNTRSRQTAP